MATCKDCFHWNACKKMLEAMWGHSVPSGYEGGADRCEDFISAADVVPRSTIDEIFALIWDAFQSTYYDSEFEEKFDEIERKYTEVNK